MIDWRQARILGDRRLEVLVADRMYAGGLLVLAGLAALLAWAVGGSGPIRRSAATLSALWLGGLDGCGELAGSRRRLWREHLFGLDLGAYLVGEFRVLAMLGTLQMLVYSGVTYGCSGFPAPVGWFALVFLIALLVGAGIGFAASALAHDTNRALAIVHLLVGLQALLVVPSGWVDSPNMLACVCPAHWGLESLSRFAATGGTFVAATPLGVLVLLGGGAWFGAFVALRHEMSPD